MAVYIRIGIDYDDAEVDHICSILESHGYEIDDAYSGEE